MPLDPQAQEILQKAKASGLPPVYTLPVDQARKRMRDAFISGTPPEPVKLVEDLRIPGPNNGLPLRVYHPNPDERLPVLVFFHGGGWTINDLDTHDAVCRKLANDAGSAVISVDYRLAPEYKYPFGLEDAYLATQWVEDNASVIKCDASRIAVGGDSSGGTMATGVSMLSRDRNGPNIIFQVLAYPVTDYYMPGTSSYVENATGYSLNRDFMIWFWTNYLPDGANLDDPYLCPLRANDLSKLPPALIMTGEYDPLRDEGRRYAERLREAGVKVDYKHYDDQMHGFIMQFRVIDRARIALEYIAASLREVFRLS